MLSRENQKTPRSKETLKPQAADASTSTDAFISGAHEDPGGRVRDQGVHAKDTEATVPDTEGKVSSYRDEAEGRVISDTNISENKCEPLERTWKPEGHSEFIMENFPKGNGQERITDVENEPAPFCL